MTYTPLHHNLLKAADIGAVVRNEDHHTILGFRVHDTVEAGLRWLIVGDHLVEAGQPRSDGTWPVLLTPLGTGVLARWDREHGAVERTGGPS